MLKPNRSMLLLSLIAAQKEPLTFASHKYSTAHDEGVCNMSLIDLAEKDEATSTKYACISVLLVHRKWVQYVMSSKAITGWTRWDPSSRYLLDHRTR